MKIGITSTGKDKTSDVDPRFGRAKYFIVADTESGEWAAHDNTQNLNAPQGAGIQAARNIIELGVETVLTGHVGPKAFSVLQSGNIQICPGATGTVEETLEQHRGGQLEAAAQADVEGHWV